MAQIQRVIWVINIKVENTHMQQCEVSRDCEPHVGWSWNGDIRELLNQLKPCWWSLYTVYIQHLKLTFVWWHERRGGSFSEHPGEQCLRSGYRSTPNLTWSQKLIFYLSRSEYKAAGKETKCRQPGRQEQLSDFNSKMLRYKNIQAKAASLEVKNVSTSGSGPGCWKTKAQSNTDDLATERGKGAGIWTNRMTGERDTGEHWDVAVRWLGQVGESEDIWWTGGAWQWMQLRQLSWRRHWCILAQQLLHFPSSDSCLGVCRSLSRTILCDNTWHCNITCCRL